MLPTSRKGGIISYQLEMKKVYIAGLVLVLLVLLVIGWVSKSSTNSGSPVNKIDDITPSSIVEATNLDRVHNNLQTLVVNSELSSYAQKRADDMATRIWSGHVDPEGRVIWLLFEKSQLYRYERVGENVAEGYFETSDVEDGWMHSPEHRENILNSHYNQIGVGTALGKNGSRYTVVLFGEIK